MPERVTKEERLVSLAIEKARKVKQELNAKNVEPTQVRVIETDPEPVKITRPKAVNVKVENQTQDKEGYGLGGETTEHKIKKSDEKRSRTLLRMVEKRLDDLKDISKTLTYEELENLYDEIDDIIVKY